MIDPRSNHGHSVPYYACIIDRLTIGFMEDDMKRLSDLEDDIEQLRRATLQIQDCFEKLIRIWELGPSGRAVAHMRLKNDFKKLELITSEFENKT